jgi:cytochrome P450
MTEILVPPSERDFDMWDLEQVGPDPYSRYAQMRSECPFGTSGRYGGFTWTVDFETMNSIAYRPEVFSSNPGTIPPMHLERPMVPLMTDPPDHRNYRKILNPFFTVQRLSALEPQIRAFTSKLCAELATRETFDAVKDFSAVIPLITLSMFFKLPEDLHADFVRWTEAISHDVAADPEGAAQAGASLAGALSDLLIERRTAPLENDLLSDLASGRMMDVELTHETSIDICFIIVIAGAATTQHGIANSLRILEKRPDIKQRLIDDPSLIPSAVEEFLRYDPPSQYVARRATCPVTVAGHEFQPGEDVALVWAAGNRDPKAFPDPDEVLIDRYPNKHASFGAGIHHCLGANLGRMEMRIALEEFLRVMPNFETTDDLNDPNKWFTGIVRGPKTVPVRLLK